MTDLRAQRTAPLLPTTMSVREWTALTVLLVAFAIAGVLRLNDLSLFTDSTRYLIWGTSIGRWEGLSDFTSPAPPRHVMNAPLYPVLLAPVLALFPLSLLAAKAATLFFGVLAIGAMFLWMRQYHGAGSSVAGAALLSVSPLFLVISTEVLSEAPFILVLLAALILIEHEHRHPTRTRRIVIAAVVIGAPLLRETALGLAAAVVLYWLVNGRQRLAFGTAASVLLVYTLWSVRADITGDPAPMGQESNLAYVFRNLVTPPGSSLAGEFSTRFVLNAKGYFIGIGGLLLYPVPAGLISDPSSLLTAVQSVLHTLRHVILLAGVAMVAHGALLDVRRSATGMIRILFLIFSLLVLLFYPVHELRFLLPLLPIVLFMLALSARDLLNRLGASAEKMRAAAVLLVLLAGGVPNILAISELLHTNIGYCRNAASFASTPSTDPAAARYYGTPWSLVGEWIRDHTPEGIVVASPAKEIVAFVGNRKVLELSRTAPLPQFERMMRWFDVRWIVSTAVWTGDSSSRLGTYWSYAEPFGESERYVFRTAARIAGVRIDEVERTPGASVRPDEVPGDTVTAAGLMQEGRRMLRNLEYRRAAALFERARLLAPDEPAAAYSLVTAHAIAGDAERGTELAGVLFTMPRATAYLPLTQIHVSLTADLQRAVAETGTVRSELAVGAARMYWELGYPQSALAICRNLVRLDSLDPQGLFWASHFSRQLGDTAEGDRYLRLLARSAPTFPPGAKLLRIRQWEETLGRTGGTGRCAHYRFIGDLYEELGMEAEALDSYERAVDCHSGDAENWAALAGAFERRQALLRARFAYGKTLELDSGNLDARRFLEAQEH